MSIGKDFIRSQIYNCSFTWTGRFVRGQDPCECHMNTTKREEDGFRLVPWWSNWLDILWVKKRWIPQGTQHANNKLIILFTKPSHRSLWWLEWGESFGIWWIWNCVIRMFAVYLGYSPTLETIYPGWFSTSAQAWYSWTIPKVNAFGP